MRPVIWHNPDCGTSRNVLHILRESGEEPDVVLYRETPPPRAEIARVVAASGMALRDAMRRKGTPFEELGLDDAALGDEDLLDAIEKHPILLNRPFVQTEQGVALCRPAERVFDLVTRDIPANLTRTDGSPLVIDREIASGETGLAEALAAELLPTGDLADTGTRFFAYATPDGIHVGYGGFEGHGRGALIRSVVIDKARRGQGLGKLAVAMLLRRAFDAGARTAWLLTETAADSFASCGFTPAARDEAPAAISETRQFVDLCPQSATLMRKIISL
ncbi:arsenic resistance N-acetyltransferase ArsN2 [Tepidamorphus sp. 3E244]|uniref:arsenic resistance N-acetyltransferase ArsN2 n=1 Tax=Tepidamorphus sp. 3E244 TaxID=3385498 RepID=UPI0038FBEE23